MKFSVLMSVYLDDNPQFLSKAISSISSEQTLQPDQIVLVCDGPISAQSEEVLNFWSAELGELIGIVRLPENKGLAYALNAGMKHCKHEYVARMDADDISLPNRFQSQVNYITSHPDISVLSAWIEEVHPESLIEQSKRLLPEKHEDISRLAKRRNPISHPVTMFKRADVLNVGGYPLFKKSQDYALWSLMLINGFKFANQQVVLLKMRAGQGLVSRRGAKYLMSEIEILKYQRSIGLIGWGGFLVNVLIRGIFRLSPNWLKMFLYKIVRTL